MLHTVRQPRSEQKWDGALLRVWNAFGLPRMEQLCGTCNQWPPTIVDIPSGASEAWAEQLALQGVKCCNGKADNCGQSDWRLALSLCAAALQLCDGGLAWRGNWRSDAAWAVARFQLLRRAAEALRASGMHGKAKKAMDCLLQCEEILEISPHSIGVTETFQFYTYLAEARRRLRDSFGARSSCRKALRVTALRPESGDSYATLFVLWVLHRAALEVEELEEAEDTLLCAQHVTFRQKERGAGADDSQLERCQRLLRTMDAQHREKVPVSDRRERKHERSHDVHWLLTRLAPSHNGIDSVAMEFAQPIPDQAPAPLHRVVRKVSFCSLAVAVSMPRRTFPTWKIAMNAESSLKEVLQRWASLYLRHPPKDALPTALRATGGSQGPNLDLDKALHAIRSSLPVLDARLMVEVSWPQEGPGEEDPGPQASPGGADGHCGPAGQLGRLRISSRYADVDRETSAFHQSTTFEAKRDAGLYQNTEGRYLQKAFQDAMRTPPMPDVVELEIASRELFVFGDSGLPSAKGSIGQVFCVALKGPLSLIDRWEATCDAFQRWEESLQSLVGSATVHMPKSTRQVPFPVFIPTRGRPWKANLNWEAHHVFGPLKPGSKVTAISPLTISPLIIIVVEPCEEDLYRDVWPMALTLVLPENGRGPGYARWVVQTVCTKGCEWVQKVDRRSKWYARRLPFIWIADDGLSMFYRLLAPGPEDNDPYISTRKGAQRLRKREAPQGVPIFHEALLAVQRHAFFPRAAISGFLRDDGTAVCKKLGWKADEMALYKIVLLNLPMLKRLGVEYMRDLRMYEDIALVHQVIQSGGRTLKCQAYCFRASHVRQGGCFDQRLKGHRQGVGTPLDHLMAPSAFRQLNRQQQRVVEELHAWVRMRERHNSVKKLGAGSNALFGQVVPGPKPLQRQGKATSPKKMKRARERTEEEKRARDHRAEYQRRKERRLELEANPRAEIDLRDR